MLKKKSLKENETKKMRKSEQGITLVALVITVIIIIILSTVTINMAFGDNGLITQAQKAKDMAANSTIAEQEGMNSVMSEYLNVMGEGSEITPPEPEVPDIPGGSEAIVTGAITFTNHTWASGQASVTISTNTSYALQYQVVANEGASNNVNWQAVPEGGIISNLNHRDVVYARLVQGTNYGEEASTTIKDENPPTISNIATSNITTSSISVTVTARDNETGIESYTYSITGKSPVTTANASYTFTGLDAKTEYTIQVTVTDKAGKTATQSVQATTKQTTPTTVADAIPGEGEDAYVFTDTTTIKDDLDNSVTIPGGFQLAEDSGTKVEDGIVIEDNTENHNQFVWIPVGEYNVTNAVDSDGTKDGKMTNALSRRTFTSSGATLVSGDDVIETYYYGEGDSRSVAKDQIGAFKTSAATKGGFYIGRYEQGAGNVCKAGVDAYVHVSRDTAKTRAEAMYSGNEEIKATTELISSYAWDTALNFICQTNTDGYELATTTDETKANIGTDNKTQTGKYEADKYSNIHDFLGNVREWTTEYSSHSLSFYTDSCVGRGGIYNDSSGYAAYRKYYLDLATFSNDYLGFRVQLYVK